MIPTISEALGHAPLPLMRPCRCHNGASVPVIILTDETLAKQLRLGGNRQVMVLQCVDCGKSTQEYRSARLH